MFRIAASDVVASLAATIALVTVGVRPSQAFWYLDVYGGNDLVVGTPGEDAGAVANSGAVHFLYSTTNGTVDGTNSRTYRQGVGGVPGTSQKNDRFGSSFTAALP